MLRSVDYEIETILESYPSIIRNEIDLYKDYPELKFILMHFNIMYIQEKDQGSIRIVVGLKEKFLRQNSMKLTFEDGDIPTLTLKGRENNGTNPFMYWINIYDDPEVFDYPTFEVWRNNQLLDESNIELIDSKFPEMGKYSPKLLLDPRRPDFMDRIYKLEPFLEFKLPLLKPVSYKNICCTRREIKFSTYYEII